MTYLYRYPRNGSVNLVFYRMSNRNGTILDIEHKRGTWNAKRLSYMGAPLAQTLDCFEICVKNVKGMYAWHCFNGRSARACELSWKLNLRPGRRSYRC
ncbi:hypothetical protein V1477_019338 [Vespula maculifrons]|uniref:S-protein homolog n=1 Tax=Vespula maculifrons TaxID=7453 RepID=A0ABD2AT20_VESMC